MNCFDYQLQNNFFRYMIIKFHKASQSIGRKNLLQVDWNFSFIFHSKDVWLTLGSSSFASSHFNYHYHHNGNLILSFFLFTDATNMMHAKEPNDWIATKSFSFNVVPGYQLLLPRWSNATWVKYKNQLYIGWRRNAHNFALRANEEE